MEELFNQETVKNWGKDGAFAEKTAEGSGFSHSLLTEGLSMRYNKKVDKK